MNPFSFKHNSSCIAALSFLVLLILLSSCKKDIPGEREPNNSFSSANPIEVNTMIEGTLGTRDDHDFFRIDITEPQIIDIQLSPVKGVNHSFKIWKSAEPPVVMKWVDDLRKSSPERICNFYAEKGVYFISVQHGERDEPKANTEDFYQLRVTARNPDPYEERESNDDIDTANHVETGREITGYFSPSYNKLNTSQAHPFREEDWFSIPVKLDSGKPFLLDVELSGVPGINSQLYFFDAEQNELGSSDLKGIGEGEMIKGIGIMKPGAYFVLVTSKNFESNNDTPYMLTVTRRDYDSQVEMEPNNGFEKANVIVNGEISGKVYPEGDRDYFLYKGEGQPRFYRLDLTPPETLDVMMRLFDSDRRLLFEIDNQPRGRKEIIPNAHLAGDVFIEVLSKKRESDPEHSYRLTVTPTPYSPYYEIEPNDRKEQANKIQGNKVIGFTSKKGDIDYFLLEYNKRVKKSFALKGVKGAELKISITDPLGYIIKTAVVKGPRTKIMKEIIDVKGYLVIEAVTDNYEEPYVVEIREDR